MQTFLPDRDFHESARVLDVRRLAGQRKECIQLCYAVDPSVRVGTLGLIERKDAADAAGVLPRRGWSSHPAARMWSGRLPALLAYLQAIDLEWLRRGYVSTLVIPAPTSQVVMPSWVGDERVHASHRSALLRKLPEHYGQFGWTEPADMEYHWPGPCTRLET